MALRVPTVTSRTSHVFSRVLSSNQYRSPDVIVDIVCSGVGMSQQTSSARLVGLKSLDESMSGEKLRLVGSLLSYDSITGLVLLAEEDQAILVDVSFCVDRMMGDWVRDRFGKIMVVGHLEAVPEELPIPTLPTYAPPPALNPMLVIKAVLVEKSEDLDLSSWSMEIERRKRYNTNRDAS